MEQGTKKVTCKLTADTWQEAIADYGSICVGCVVARAITQATGLNAYVACPESYKFAIHTGGICGNNYPVYSTMQPLPELAQKAVRVFDRMINGRGMGVLNGETVDESQFVIGEFDITVLASSESEVLEMYCTEIGDR
jgi:hypothetical protein